MNILNTGATRNYFIHSKCIWGPLYACYGASVKKCSFITKMYSYRSVFVCVKIIQVKIATALLSQSNRHVCVFTHTQVSVGVFIYASVQ